MKRQHTSNVMKKLTWAVFHSEGGDFCLYAFDRLVRFLPAEASPLQVLCHLGGNSQMTSAKCLGF